MEDLSTRAKKILDTVDIVLCEDTRRTANLTSNKLFRFDEYTEEKLIPQILTYKTVALVSDAGTPLISDPGYKLVREAIRRGIKVVSIPGPTAAIAALTSSGLPTNKFLFLGYPPEKQSHRIKLFQSLPKDTTIIFCCAPHKLRQTLEDMESVFGDIPIVIARELTKVHEELWRGKLSEVQWREFKGEIVILFRLD